MNGVQRASAIDSCDDDVLRQQNVFVNERLFGETVREEAGEDGDDVSFLLLSV